MWGVPATLNEVNVILGKYHIDIIGLSETDINLYITDYSHSRHDRNLNHGVCIYYKTGLPLLYNSTATLPLVEGFSPESIWTTLQKKHSKKLVIGFIYIPLDAEKQHYEGPPTTDRIQIQIRIQKSWYWGTQIGT